MNTSYRITYGEVVFVYEFIHTESTLGCWHSKESGNSLEGFVFFFVQCYNSRIQKMVRSTLKVLNKCPPPWINLRLATGRQPFAVRGSGLKEEEEAN